MAVLFLNAKNAVIGAQIVAIGTDNGLAATPAQILRGAIMAGANAIIVAHNHPSGEPTPSREDIAFTVNLKAACEVLGVVLVDHVIVTANPNRAHSFCNCYTAPWSSGG
jgi:DNA repair protein RadC